MFNQSFNTEVNPGDASANTKYRPPRDGELDGQYSYPSPDKNRHIDKMLQEVRLGHRQHEGRAA